MAENQFFIDSDKLSEAALERKHTGNRSVEQNEPYGIYAGDGTDRSNHKK